jgi:hypoxanthine-guanine phosphoribosyltransferase
MNSTAATHQQPASLKIVALLHKPEATVFPMHIDYLGFSIPDKFVVGYGLDYDGWEEISQKFTGLQNKHGDPQDGNSRS